MRGLDLAAYETLHRSRKTVEQISTETGLNKSSLYRYGLPPESNGLDIPTRKLVPIMRSAGNYTILKTLAAACGFLLVRVPRSARILRPQPTVRRVGAAASAYPAHNAADP